MIPSPGAIVAGKLRLERPLAQGGMGSVWVAYNQQLDVPVAVKFMAASFAGSAELVTRFEREAKAAAQLRHPNVVQVFEHGVFDGLPYIVMELLEGESLGIRLKLRRRLLLVEVSNILGQVCLALRRAHERGLVHRDLKPANIFISRHDEIEVVKVLDFGIVKTITTASEDITKSGAIFGSPHYMSPEQARKTNRPVDHRSDLWALGVIAYRALTGQLPFPGDDTIDVLVRMCTESPPKPTSVASDLSPEVDAFVERALARDPDQRFQSAREFAEALARLAGQGRTVAALESWPASISGLEIKLPDMPMSVRSAAPIPKLSEPQAPAPPAPAAQAAPVAQAAPAAAPSSSPTLASPAAVTQAATPVALATNPPVTPPAPPRPPVPRPAMASTPPTPVPGPAPAAVAPAAPAAIPPPPETLTSGAPPAPPAATSGPAAPPVALIAASAPSTASPSAPLAPPEGALLTGSGNYPLSPAAVASSAGSALTGSGNYPLSPAAAGAAGSALTGSGNYPLSPAAAGAAGSGLTGSGDYPLSEEAQIQSIPGPSQSQPGTLTHAGTEIGIDDNPFRRKRPTWLVAAMAGGAVVAVALVIGLISLSGGSPDDAAVGADKPPEQPLTGTVAVQPAPSITDSIPPAATTSGIPPAATTSGIPAATPEPTSTAQPASGASSQAPASSASAKPKGSSKPTGGSAPTGTTTAGGSGYLGKPKF